MGRVKFTREVFSSPIDQAIVVRLTADKPGKISFTARISGAHKTNSSFVGLRRTDATGEGNLLVLRGTTGPARRLAGLRYEARLKTTAQGGTVTVKDDTVTVKEADAATLLLVAASNFVNYKNLSGDPRGRTRKYLAKIGNKSYDQLIDLIVCRNIGERKRQRLWNDDTGQVVLSHVRHDERGPPIAVRFDLSGFTDHSRLFFRGAVLGISGHILLRAVGEDRGGCWACNAPCALGSRRLAGPVQEVAVSAKGDNPFCLCKPTR